MSHEPRAGRPGWDLPVFMNQIDGSCPLMSVCIERMRSDVIHDAREMRKQLGHFHSALAVLLKLPRTAKELFGRAVDEAERDLARVILAAALRVNSGLGSKRSTWLGPPCMNREIIARACGSKCGTLGRRSNDCGFRGTLGGVASNSSSANSHASATEPMPIALRVRNCRRVQKRSAEYGATFISNQPPECTNRVKVETPKLSELGQLWIAPTALQELSQ